jgi:hypothetical protein
MDTREEEKEEKKIEEGRKLERCKGEKYKEKKEKTDLFTRFAKRPLPAAAGRPCPVARRDPGCSCSACTSTV